MKKILLIIALSLPAVLFYSCKKDKTQPAIVLPTDEFIDYSVNGVPYNFTMTADSVFADTMPETPMFNEPNKVIGQRVPHSAGDFARIDYERIGIGLGSIQSVRLFYTPQTGLFPYTTTTSGPVMITITEYGNVGEYIAGNFSGLFTGPPPGNNQYNVICSFRVRRRI